MQSELHPLAQMVAWGIVTVLILLPLSLIATSAASPCICPSKASVVSCCVGQGETFTFVNCPIVETGSCCEIQEERDRRAETKPTAPDSANPCPLCFICPVCMPFSPVLASMLPPQEGSLPPPNAFQIPFFSSAESPSDGARRLIERPPIGGVA